jgi:hypothetical protein
MVSIAVLILTIVLPVFVNGHARLVSPIPWTDVASKIMPCGGVTGYTVQPVMNLSRNGIVSSLFNPTH